MYILDTQNSELLETASPGTPYAFISFLVYCTVIELPQSQCKTFSQCRLQVIHSVLQACLSK